LPDPKRHTFDPALILGHCCSTEQEIQVAKKPAKAATVLELVEQATGAINVSELAVAMLEEFGGLVQFAREYKKEFDEATPGSISRSKMLEGMMRVINMATPKNAVSDLSQLEGGDLEKVATSILEKAGVMQTDGPQANEQKAA
jgi:hypothetical protein